MNESESGGFGSDEVVHEAGEGGVGFESEFVNLGFDVRVGEGTNHESPIEHDLH